MEIKKKFTEAANAMPDDDYDRFMGDGPCDKKKKNRKKIMWSQFWSAHQRFFKYLCIAAKVKHAVELAK